MKASRPTSCTGTFSSSCCFSMYSFWRTLLIVIVGANVIFVWLTLSRPWQSHAGSRKILTTVDQRKSNGTCEEDWPDLELFMPLASNPSSEWEIKTAFAPSLALFWPNWHIRLRIITDKENPNSPKISNSVKVIIKSLTGVEVASDFAPPYQAALVHTNTGWHKAQWLRFWADNFTSAEFVGFVDTDTTFVTRVTPGDLFRDGKPIVRPIFGGPQLPGYWEREPATTEAVTGFKEPFNCMAYFPVIIKRAHFAKFRQAIIKKSGNNNLTFDNAYALATRTANESEFNIMCTFMWHRHRDEYHWIINRRQVNWTGPPVKGQVASLDEAGIPSEMVHPSPMLAGHWTWQKSIHSGINLRTALRRGFCYSLTANETHPKYCKQFPDRQKNVNPTEFHFEKNDFSSRPGALESHLERIARNEKCPHGWHPASLKALA